MTDRRHAVAALQVGNRLLPRLDAIQEIAHMLAKLLALIAGFVLELLRPVLAGRGIGANRSADRMGVGELRDRIAWRQLAICYHDEPAPRDTETSFRAEKLQPGWPRGSARRLAMRPDGGPAR